MALYWNWVNWSDCWLMVEILNYQSDLQGIKTFINKPVLWPVYEYTVAVKGLPSFGDNELETLVLRLAQINIRDVNEIAKCSGLEQDLVAFIQERLNHKGFLDEFMQLTENGLAKISNSNNAENVQYMMMYRDAVSGDMLSKILREETRKPLHYFQDQESMMQEEGSTKYFSFKDLTTVGDEEIESKRFAAFDPIVPKIKAELSTDDIKSVIKKNGLTAGNCSFSSSGEGKLVYLKVVMILQEGNTTDWLCTDGFGNLSPFFGSRIKYLNSQNQEYIKGLRKQSIISDASYSYSKKDTSDEMLEWRAYPQIGKYLKDSEDLLAEIKDSNPNNSGEVEALVQTKVECTEKIYSLIEWIFFYKNYSQVNEIKSVLGKLLQNTEKYTDFSVNIAKKR